MPTLLHLSSSSILCWQQPRQRTKPKNLPKNCGRRVSSVNSVPTFHFCNLFNQTLIIPLWFQAKMECLVRILLWSSVLTWTRVSSQFSAARGKEVFFVNLEEGFFGCQVNETAEVLQIFKINKLCDGVSDCFRGSDENSKELKCSSKWKDSAASVKSQSWQKGPASLQSFGKAVSDVCCPGVQLQCRAIKLGLSDTKCCL